MIKQAAEHITAILKICPGIIAELGEDIYWELAEEKTTHPFLTFTIQGNGGASKDSLNDYTIALRIFSKKLSDAARISEILISELNTASNWRSKGSRSGYTDTSAKEGFIELTYNFKM
jgi:hypothetical protein